jgi:hypothetical protein
MTKGSLPLNVSCRNAHNDTVSESDASSVAPACIQPTEQRVSPGTIGFDPAVLMMRRDLFVENVL